MKKFSGSSINLQTLNIQFFFNSIKVQKYDNEIAKSQSKKDLDPKILANIEEESLSESASESDPETPRDRNIEYKKQENLSGELEDPKDHQSPTEMLATNPDPAKANQVVSEHSITNIRYSDRKPKNERSDGELMDNEGSNRSDGNGEKMKNSLMSKESGNNR